MRLLILADDLTGAMDTGVQFAKLGAATAAVPRPENLPEGGAATCEVLCLNTETRHLSPAKAHARILSLLARFPGAEYTYIKTDSALRGNLSAVFHAVTQHLGQPIMFVPAFPKAGRTTRQGRQYVGGLPLEQSAFANDPLNPMYTSSVANILSENYPLHSQLCPQLSSSSLSSLPPAPPQVTIFDAETDSDLLAIGQQLASQSLLTLTAGCAGFAEVLAQHLRFAQPPAAFQPVDKPILFLSGSANAATFEQLSLARQQGMAIFTIAAEMKTAAPTADALNALAETLAATLHTGRSVILATAETAQGLAKGSTVQHGAIAAVFAGIAQRLAGSPLSGLALFGGDTALAVLDALHIGMLYPTLEIEAGLPLCRLPGGPVPALVTKSGGLGSSGAVLAIENTLRHTLTTKEK